MAWDAERFGISPYKGARADQPAGLLKRMRIVLNVYETMAAAKEYLKDGNIKEFSSHPSYKIYTYVTELRKKQNG